MPVLPAHFSILDGEAGTFGLRNNNRLGPGQGRPALGVVEFTHGWHGHDPVICKPRHFLADHVDGKKYPAHFAILCSILGIDVVLTPAPPDSATVLFGKSDVASRRRVADN